MNPGGLFGYGDNVTEEFVAKVLYARPRWESAEYENSTLVECVEDAKTKRGVRA